MIMITDDLEKILTLRLRMIISIIMLGVFSQYFKLLKKDLISQCYRITVTSCKTELESYVGTWIL